MDNRMTWLPFVCLIAALTGCGAPVHAVRVAPAALEAQSLVGCEGKGGCTLAIRKAIRARLEAEDAAWVHSLNVGKTDSGVVFAFEAVLRDEASGAYAEVEGTYNTLTKRVSVTKRTPLAEAPGKKNQPAPSAYSPHS